MAAVVHDFSTADERAQSLALAIAADLRQLLQQKERVVLAVSGGSTPKQMFRALSEQVLDWERVILMLVDERCVPCTHEASNFALMRRYLHQNQAAAANVVHYLDEQHLQDLPLLEVHAAHHFLVPDIVVLGMGTDGHTASLFPDSAQFANAMSETAKIVALIPVAAPHWRLTLTFGAIIQAQRIYVELSGLEKRALLENILSKQMAELPMACVLQHHQVNAQVYLS